MHSHFKMTHRESHGNLHIRTEGVFDGNSAWELINLITDKNNGTGRIFIDTHHLGELCPFGCHTFKTRMDLRVVPPSRLYFKGPKGFRIAPNGSRVIIVPADKKRQCPKAAGSTACRGYRKNISMAVGG
jgi:hypothetical protein